MFLTKRIHLSETESTNDFIKNWLKDNAPNQYEIAPLLVTTLKQTKGRGRMGKVWLQSDAENADNIYMSLLIKDDINPTLLNMIASIAVRLVSIKYSNGNIKIKWPNDIVLDGKKLAGILIEREGSYNILGIGINLNGIPNTKGIKEEDLIPTALSSKIHINRLDFINKLIKVFEQLITASHDATSIAKQVNDSLWLKGLNGLIKRDGEQDLAGIVSHVNPSGSLVMISDQKQVEIFSGSLRENDHNA